MAKKGWFARNRHLYPYDWDKIAKRIKKAAGWRCQACDAPHGPPPNVLTVDHLDHNPSNCATSNLMALCQRCHLRRQGMAVQPKTKREALRRLRRRAEEERTQGEFAL